MKRKNIVSPKALFTTGLPRTFRASNIAHLYEVSQVYPVVLLSEKLDPETEKILHDKALFPKLEKIIPYRQFTGEKTNLFSPLKNYYYYKLAKEIIEKYKPDILIAGDTHLFQLYLSRFAKKIKPILHISIQGGLTGDMRQISLSSYLTNAYLKMPLPLPLGIKFFFTKCKKYLGHFLYFWILPLTVGEAPFRVKASFILRKGDDGMNAADFSIVYSKRYYTSALKNGVPAEKLYILPHPLARKTTREFFGKTFFTSAKPQKIDKKIATLMYSEQEIGFRRKDHSLISKKKMRETRLEIINLIVQILKEWKIFIKPHPETSNIKELKKTLEAISNNATVTKPSEPVDRYIEKSKVIIGVPPASTTLWTASLRCPDKIILSLDLYHELLGDTYKDFNGIEYIDNKEKFINLLKEIRDNRFQKKRYKAKSKLELNEFSNLVGALEYFLRKKNATTW